MGLRRAAQGVVKMLVDFEQLTGLASAGRWADVVARARRNRRSMRLGDISQDERKQLWAFLMERLRHLMERRGLQTRGDPRGDGPRVVHRLGQPLPIWRSARASWPRFERRRRLRRLPKRSSAQQYRGDGAGDRSASMTGGDDPPTAARTRRDGARSALQRWAPNSDGLSARRGIAPDGAMASIQPAAGAILRRGAGHGRRSGAAGSAARAAGRAAGSDSEIGDISGSPRSNLKLHDQGQSLHSIADRTTIRSPADD